MSTGTLRGQEGQPLVVGKMMYFESSYPNYVYAVDLDNIGRIAWKFSPEQDKFAPSVACCDVVNRGLAYGDGKILITTLDTHVYALDAKTGQVVWNAQNGDPKLGQTMTMAPLVVHDKVIVGISGGGGSMASAATSARMISIPASSCGAPTATVRTRRCCLILRKRLMGQPRNR